MKFRIVISVVVLLISSSSPVQATIPPSGFDVNFYDSDDPLPMGAKDAILAIPAFCFTIGLDLWNFVKRAPSAIGAAISEKSVEVVSSQLDLVGKRLLERQSEPDSFSSKSRDQSAEVLKNFLDALDSRAERFGQKAVLYWTAGTASTLGLLLIYHYSKQYLERKAFQPIYSLEESDGRVRRYIKKLFSHVPSLDDLVFSSETREQLDDFVIELRAAYRHRLPMPTRLFLGPSGTGKMSAAQTLARQEGFHFVVLSVSALSQLSEKEGLQQITQLFQWAKRRNKTIIFMNEMNLFLADRTHPRSSKHLRLLKHFLTLMKDRSPRYTVIGTAHRREEIDPEVIDRFTAMTAFDLPNQLEREELLRFYLQKSIVEDRSYGKITLEDPAILRDSSIVQLAKQTEGFSGAKIKDLIESAKLLSLGMKTPTFSSSLMSKVLKQMKRKQAVMTLVSE